MHVDEAGRNHEPGGVDHCASSGFDLGLELDDPAVLDEDIQGLVSFGGGVDSPAVLNQYTHFLFLTREGEGRFIFYLSSAGSAIRTSSSWSTSMSFTWTISRREVGRTFPA